MLAQVHKTQRYYWSTFYLLVTSNLDTEHRVPRVSVVLQVSYYYEMIMSATKVIKKESGENFGTSRFCSARKIPCKNELKHSSSSKEFELVLPLPKNRKQSTITTASLGNRIMTTSKMKGKP